MIRAALLCVGLGLAAPGFAAACRFSQAGGAPIPGSQAVWGDGSAAAWYEDPTAIYGHNIMGDAPEALTIAMVAANAAGDCIFARAAVGENHVFEDIAPRLADLDGDGQPEVIAVRASIMLGAQLVIYTQGGDGMLEVLATTPYIGRRNRWLAPAAIADLDGDGHVEVAYVDRPHLAKILRIWRYADGDFREVTSLGGLSNHRIGEAFISGGLRDCGAGPEIVLARGDWTGLVAVRMEGDDLTAHPLETNQFAAALACR